MKVVVIGIGHSLRGDDAAGLESVRAWQRDYPETASLPSVQTELIESAGLELVSAFEAVDAALLVDAVRSGATAGTLHRLGEGDIMGNAPAAGSLHGWGISQILHLAKALDNRTEQLRLRLLGIEAAQMDLGAPLSQAVQCSIPAAAAAIDSEIRTFLGKQRSR